MFRWKHVAHRKEQRMEKQKDDTYLTFKHFGWHFHNPGVNGSMSISGSLRQCCHKKHIKRQEALFRTIKCFLPNESRSSSTHVNPIRGTRGAGFPLLMPDTFPEPPKEASQAACYSLWMFLNCTDLTACKAPVNPSLQLFTNWTRIWKQSKKSQGCTFADFSSQTWTVCNWEIFRSLTSQTQNLGHLFRWRSRNICPSLPEQRS